MFCIAAALCSVMFLLGHVDDLCFLSQMEILCKEEIEFSYALRFVWTTPFYTKNSYVPSYANFYWEQS